MKIRVLVSRSEIYPVYHLAPEKELEPMCHEFFLTQEEIDFVNKASEDYDKAQDILSDAWIGE